MREIKFRAWDKIEKIWVYFVFRPEPCQTRLEWVSVNGVMIEDYDEIYEYTGLSDKNGKEIYEGDIVKMFDLNKCIYIVEFGKQDIGHDFQGVGFYTKRKDGSQFNIFGGEQIEIIGNIYESPELMEEQRCTQ